MLDNATWRLRFDEERYRYTNKLDWLELVSNDGHVVASFDLDEPGGEGDARLCRAAMPAIMALQGIANLLASHDVNGAAPREKMLRAKIEAFISEAAAAMTAPIDPPERRPIPVPMLDSPTIIDGELSYLGG